MQTLKRSYYCAYIHFWYSVSFSWILWIFLVLLLSRTDSFFHKCNCTWATYMACILPNVGIQLWRVNRRRRSRATQVWFKQFKDF